jgi:hypothetical protein
MHPFFQKPWPIPQTSEKKFEKNKINSKTRDQAAGRHLCRVGLVPFYLEIIFSPALHFLHKWSTLAGWFQLMPALPIVHLKTSNTHNFWTVVPKIMKFALTRSLFRDASSQKVSKNLKIVWDHTTQPIIGLSPVGTSGPLGVKFYNCFNS